MAGIRALVILSGTDNVVFLVGLVLDPMSDPPSNSGNSEKYWEHVSGESHRAVDDTTVEVNIRV